jgi:hypothetical protein
MTETANAAMKSNRWQGSDGIITEGQDGDLNANNDGRGFKGMFGVSSWRTLEIAQLCGYRP